MFLFTLLACGGGASAPQADHGHDHAKTEAHGHEDHDGHQEGHDDGHAHDHDEGHDHAAGHDHDGGHDAKVPVDATEVIVAMGSRKARLVPGAGALELQVLGEDGAPVTAEGEAKMVLTGTGQAEQRIVLKADGTSWKGDAKLAGAKGYLAVVSVPVGGATQSARFAWGEVPEAAPAPAPHDHGEGGHGHDH